MRKPSLGLAAAVALALASGVAVAQVSGAGTTRATTTAGTTSTTSAAGATSGTPSTGTNTTTVGGCRPTGGSTCVASDSDSSAAANANSTGTTTSSSTSDFAQRAPATSSGGAVSGSGSVSGSAMGTNQAGADVNTANTSSFTRGGSFANDSGNSALGTSAGQTSSGTAAGNSSAGIGTPPPSTATTGFVGVLPGDTGFLAVPAPAANGERVINSGTGLTQPSTVTVYTTPLLDATTREAQAREQRRRRSGNEPRIIGIAPRTDADLTHQMPDDRIIRY